MIIFLFFNLIFSVLLIGIVQGIIVGVLRKKNYKKYLELAKHGSVFMNLHNTDFSRFLYNFKEEIKILKVLKIVNVLVFPYIIISAVLLSIYG